MRTDVPGAHALDGRPSLCCPRLPTSSRCWVCGDSPCSPTGCTRTSALITTGRQLAAEARCWPPVLRAPGRPGRGPAGGTGCERCCPRGSRRDVAKDPGAARAGEELQNPPGHLVVVGAEVFQVPAARADVRVVNLDRPVAQEDMVAVREEGQDVPGIEAAVLSRPVSSGAGTWNPAARRGPRIFLCRRCLSAWDSSDPGWAGSVNGMPY